MLARSTSTDVRVRARFVARATIVLVGSLPEPIGGVAENCFQVSNELAERNAAVHFLDSERGGVKRLPRLTSYSTLTGRYVTGLLLALTCPRLVWSWLRTAVPLSNRLGLGTIQALVLSHRIFRTTRRSKANLLVAHHAGRLGLAAVIAARATSTPLTLFIHGAEWAHEKWKSERSVARLVSNAADRVLANSRYTAGLCREATGRTDIAVIYPGVDHNAFRPAAREDEAPARPPVVLFVGAMHPRKGADVFADAIGRLPREVSARFVFAGPAGSLTPHVTASVAASGRSEDVQFLGKVPAAELPAVYQSADVFVFPTVWATEGFGLVAAEALACGVPVVGSRIGAIPEVVVDGETGLLFEPGDAGDLAAKLTMLLTDRSLRSFLARNAIRRAKAYTWAHYADDLLASAAGRDDAVGEAAFVSEAM